MKRTRSMRAAIALVTTLALAGCGFLGGTMNDPRAEVRSQPNGLSTKSKPELLDEAIQQTYVVAQLIGAETSTDFDPEALAEKVRTYWESLGYTVRQIGPSERDSERYRSIHVDLPYKSGLEFSASTRILGIGVDSECAKWD